MCEVFQPKRHVRLLLDVGHVVRMRSNWTPPLNVCCPAAFTKNVPSAVQPMRVYLSFETGSIRQELV